MCRSVELRNMRFKTRSTRNLSQGVVFERRNVPVQIRVVSIFLLSRSSAQCGESRVRSFHSFADKGSCAVPCISSQLEAIPKILLCASGTLPHHERGHLFWPGVNAIASRPDFFCRTSDNVPNCCRQALHTARTQTSFGGRARHFHPRALRHIQCLSD